MPSELRLTAEEAAARPVLLRTVVGSEVHGTALDAGGDIDNMAIGVESPDQVLGIQQSPAQWAYRTAWNREDGTKGVAARSYEGDLDYTIYPARKWAVLALNGNPSVMVPLFVEDRYLMVADEFGAELRANRHRFISKHLATKHYGYMVAQKGMVGSQEKNRKISRPELITAHGFDTKFAAHYLRLGHQGLHVLEHATLPVPLDESIAESIRAVRRGDRTLADVLAEGEDLENRILAALDTSSIPDDGDVAWVHDWLARTQLRTWGFV